jgi:hypothetical protein
MAFSFVQANATGNGATSTTIGVAFGVAVTSGNFVIGIVSWDNGGGGALNSVTDDKGNTYNKSSTITNATNNQDAAIFWLGNITNAPTTITANLSATSLGRSISIAEYSGGNAVTDPSDGNTGQAQSSPGTGTDAVVSTNIVTTTGADMIAGFSATTNGTTHATTGTGFNDRPTSQINGGGAFAALTIEDENQGSPGSVQSTFTAVGGTDNFVTFVLAIKAAAAQTPITAGFFVEDTTLQRPPQNQRMMRPDPLFATPAQPLPIMTPALQPGAAGVCKVRMIPN